MAATWWDGGDVSQTLDAVLSKGQTMPEKNRFPAVLVPATAHTLRAEGFDASEDGNDGGVYQDGSTRTMTTAPPAIAFSCKDHGADAGEIAPTLRSMGHKDSHQNAGGQVAVAFNLRGRDGGAMPEVDPDGLACQRAASGGSSRSYVATSDPIAFTQNSRSEVREIGGDGSIVGALAADAGAQQQNYLSHGTAVRRLTPRECERLQGFPDDYTLIPWRGRPANQCPDGPRYKALGNSMAVPCMLWIGRSIQAHLARA